MPDSRAGTTILIPSEKEIHSAASMLLKTFPAEKVFAFFGEMGAGKTTLIKEICRQLGVKEVEISSPTFALINQYSVHSSPNPLYHFDFYRIERQTEVFDLGYEEYFFSGNYCFIEWAEKISNLLPKGCVKIHINVLEEKRILICQKN